MLNLKCAVVLGIVEMQTLIFCMVLQPMDVVVSEHTSV